MPTDTFLIGNGKTAKVGDKVWEPWVKPRHFEITGFARPHIVLSEILHVYPESVFVTEREARDAYFLRLLGEARTRLAQQEALANDARAEIATLESLLREELHGNA